MSLEERYLEEFERYLKSRGIGREKAHNYRKSMSVYIVLVRQNHRSKWIFYLSDARFRNPYLDQYKGQKNLPDKVAALDEFLAFLRTSNGVWGLIEILASQVGRTRTAKIVSRIVAIISGLLILRGAYEVIPQTYFQPSTSEVATPLATIAEASKTQVFTVTIEATPPDVIRNNSDWDPVLHEFDGVPMMLVPPGCFTLGEDPPIYPDETPQTACVDKAFWVDKFEVTRAEYGVSQDPDEANLPQTDISWRQARYYCSSRGGRLPTELEWEYMASGPSDWTYPWGTDFDSSRAVFLGNSDGHSFPVGTMDGASWVGAYDLAGNVWEWTSTLYQAYPYNKNDGRENPDVLGKRVIRGGSWRDANNDLRTAHRFGKEPDELSSNAGFRCVRDFQPGDPTPKGISIG